MASLFLGMISAFLGMVFADIRQGLEGWMPIFVLLVSALLMALCGLLIKKCGWKWLETYAMTVSMLGAMIFAVAITPYLDDICAVFVNSWHSVGQFVQNIFCKLFG